MDGLENTDRPRTVDIRYKLIFTRKVLVDHYLSSLRLAYHFTVLITYVTQWTNPDAPDNSYTRPSTDEKEPED